MNVNIFICIFISVFFFLPLVKSVQSIPRQTHTYALFVKVEKGFLCKWLETMTNVYNRHGSFFHSFIHSNFIITNKGKSVAVHLDSFYLCVCAQSCFPDQLCFLPCAVHWAMSKSINMWKKYTSLWSTVHCVLVRSGVGVGGAGSKGNKRKCVCVGGGVLESWRRFQIRLHPDHNTLSEMLTSDVLWFGS